MTDAFVFESRQRVVLRVERKRKWKFTSSRVGSEVRTLDYLKYRVFSREVLKVTENDYVNDMAEYTLTMG